MEDTAELGTQLWLSEWFIWPPAQFVNFYFLPTKYRVVYDNLVSLFYDWYTSHLKHSRAAVEELKGQDFMVLEDQILNLESESDHVESESMGLRQVLWQRLGPPPPPFGGRFSTRWYPPSPPIVKHIKMQFGTIQQISDEILKYILSSTSAWLLQEIWILGVKRATRWKKSSTRKGKVRDNKSSRSDSFMFPKFRIGHVVTSLLFELLMALLRFSDSSGKGVFVCSTFSLPFICQTISC